MAYVTSYNVIQKVATLAGIIPTPRGITNDQAIVTDPFYVRGTIAGNHTTPIQTVTDITAGELSPFPAPQGVLTSRGTSQAYVGYVYGLTVYPQMIVPDDGPNPNPGVWAQMLANVELVWQTAGRARSLPFRSLARINPHLVTATADEQMQTSGAPGKPAYLLPVEPLPWSGVASASVGVRDLAGYNMGAMVCSFDVEVWGVFARGSASDVDGSGCPVPSQASLLERLRKHAQIRAAVLNGSPLPADAFTIQDV
jgi:hypothetical protein